MKIAINVDFGGFGLSDKAFESLLEKKGIQFDKGQNIIGDSNYYNKGYIDNNDYFISQYDYYTPRNDPDLIAVIEEFGDDAHGWAAVLKIVEIPDDVEWQIEEYDGREHIAEKHRTWC
jgi:hypothetical protein